MFILIEYPLILEPGTEFSLPIFNSKVKFTVVLEEVLYTLLTFFFLSGNLKLTNVVNDLINVLDRSDRAIGDALKTLKQLDLISYYQDGRYKTVVLHLENEFLKSTIARFFGVIDFTKTNCQKLKRMLIGFYPILDLKKTMAMFQDETKRLDDLIHEHKYLFDWIHKVEELESLAKTTNSIEDFPDGNPILSFIDQLVSAINFQQSIQTEDLTGLKVTEIVTEILEEFKEIPPWLDTAVIGGSNPWVILEDDM